MTDITCISPIDGSEAARRPALSFEDAKAAFDKARAAQPAWAATPLEARKAAIVRFVEALEAKGDPLVPELAKMMGRPVRYGGELGGVRERALAMVELADEALAPYIPPAREGFVKAIKRVPAGVVLVLAPWNYPYLTAVNAIVPALLAGNSVILKHAAQTLLAGERIAEAMATAGIPEGVFQNLVLTHETVAQLIAARLADHVNFTGSVAGGRAIETAAAGGFTSVTLELGGKDPGYVRADADLDAAVAGLIDGAMFNSGQCCCGIERIYVHESLYEAFVEKAAALVSTYALGDPMDPATTLGPMASARGAETVRRQVAEAVAAGARPLIDPAKFPEPGAAYCAPQVLVDVDHSMEVMREETFGPVVGIMKVKDDDEAVAMMNDSPYGLTVSIWTRDAQAADALGDRLQTGTVFMNRCDYVDPYLAWTGVKDTGRGASLSPLGFAAMTRPRSFHLKLA